MIEKMRLKASDTVLVVVDVQERLARVMERREQVSSAPPSCTIFPSS
jgi:hypothetical protein